MSTSTVIIGAGIIGCSTAYYLSESSNTQSDTIHLIENSPNLFASASGYAAGFLAADWFGADTAAVSALSFRLHKQLAEEHAGAKRWGYSRTTSSSMKLESGPKKVDEWLRDGGSRAALANTEQDVPTARTHQGGPVWLTNGNVEIISEEGTTAQV